MKKDKITLQRAVNCAKPLRVEPNDKQRAESDAFHYKNGFYYEECWNLDGEVAYQILIRLVQYRQTGCRWCTPGCFVREDFGTEYADNKRWRTQVDKMIRAFYLYVTVFMPDEKQERIIRKGMKLFFEHFSALWY